MSELSQAEELDALKAELAQERRRLDYVMENGAPRHAFEEYFYGTDEEYGSGEVETFADYRRAIDHQLSLD